MRERTIVRTEDRRAVEGLLGRFPVVGLLGARQVGKSTLARQVFGQGGRRGRYFDLEDRRDLASLQDPFLALEPLRGLVVLDEIQRRPDLFPALRVLADRPGRPARFLVLGSASPDLLRQSSESLAGRIAYRELRGFSLDDVGARKADRLWVRGGFPSSFLGEDDEASFQWREHFLRTFLERDLPGLGIGTPAATLGRFWAMLAHWHGQNWNGAELARGLGVVEPTVRRYLDLLRGTLVVDVLPPWHENLSKRQVKAPRVCIADSGLLHALLGVRTREDLEGHPKVGASWEGFVRTEVLRRLGADPREAYFWATHAGAELDLLVVRGRRRLGFEMKRSTAPTVTKSMRIAQEDLGLEEIVVVHAGEESFPMAPGIRAVAAGRILEDIEPLG
jgi:predicted AAA+ superfamily ATPase